jgi:hypothetical protein
MKIATSCGATFDMTAREMSNHQIEVLLKRNQDRNDVDPAEVAELRNELARRSELGE